MDIFYLEGLPAPVTKEELYKALHIGEADSETAKDILRLVNGAADIALPKSIVCKVSAAHAIDTISSEFVKNKLSVSMYVYPFAVTCGKELDELAADDMFGTFVKDVLKELYLRKMISLTADRIKNACFSCSDMSCVSPGSLESRWSISGQAELFRLIGSNIEKTGITLTESFLMLPEKSVSGIWYSDSEHFENCMLCPRTDCPSRRCQYKEK